MLPVREKKTLILLHLEGRPQVLPKLRELRGIQQDRVIGSLFSFQADQLFRRRTYARVGGQRGGIGLLCLEPDLQGFDIGLQNGPQLGSHFRFQGGLDLCADPPTNQSDSQRRDDRPQPHALAQKTVSPSKVVGDAAGMGRCSIRTHKSLWESASLTLSTNSSALNSSLQKAVLKPRALQTLRDFQASRNRAKRLECGVFHRRFRTGEQTFHWYHPRTEVR